MTEELFNQLCYVRGFNNLNGNTYQEHILVIAGDRIPENLHDNIKNAKTSLDALNILDDNKIDYNHNINQ